MAGSDFRQIFINTGRIAHFSVGDIRKPLVGSEMSADEQLHEAGMGFVVEDGNFSKIAHTEEIIAEYGSGVAMHDFGGHAVVPGYIDAHTHLLWAGDRTREVRMRQNGMSYSDIANAGGGIRYTVGETRKSSDLYEIGRSRLATALGNGTTTLEAKSGYGLDTASEQLLLDTTNRLSEYDAKYPDGILIESTWMGAHDIPSDMKRVDYVEHLISEQLPHIVEKCHPTNADVFCEPGWFTLEDTEEICKAAKEAGLKIRLHVDEFTDGDGLQLAAELGATTADHAIHSSDDARAAASNSGVLQGFLPGTPYVLGSDKWPPIQKCIDEEWAWTLASDFNPNYPSLSIPMAGSLAMHRMNIDPIASLAAVTRNPATSVFVDSPNPIGVIIEGAIANFNVLDSEHIESWCSSPGQSGIKDTFVSGLKKR